MSRKSKGKAEEELFERVATLTPLPSLESLVSQYFSPTPSIVDNTMNKEGVEGGSDARATPSHSRSPSTSTSARSASEPFDQNDLQQVLRSVVQSFFAAALEEDLAPAQLVQEFVNYELIPHHLHDTIDKPEHLVGHYVLDPTVLGLATTAVAQIQPTLDLVQKTRGPTRNKRVVDRQGRLVMGMQRNDNPNSIYIAWNVLRERV